MSRSSDIKEISNPQEFKRILFERCSSFILRGVYYNRVYIWEWFLEVIALEELKKIQKKTFGDRTRRKFYSIILLTEGETEETIGHKNTILTGIYVLYF